LKNSRRGFLKLTGLTGLGLASGLPKGFAAESGNDQFSAGDKGSSSFNMSGYGAPKLDTVRIGFIGLGNRGPNHLKHALKLENVEIKALCDLRPEKANAANELVKGSGNSPEIFSGKEDSWKELCAQKDIDLIYIATPWYLHAPMAIYAMQQGKHVAVEVPAAITLEECWQLVKTSESTKKHCVMLENCCYDFFELLTLNMARQGFFGEIIHGEGAYIHDLLKGNFSKEKYYDMWRLKQNFRNGDLYPTHGLGPVAQVMNINRGDKMDYMVSLSGADFMMGAMEKELVAKDDFYKPFENKKFRGNMNTTVIRTAKGRSIMLQHDVSSPNVYSRIHKISGVKGSALKYPLPGKIAVGDAWSTPEEYNALEEKYTPAIVKKIGEMAKEVGGHGGMDFLMNWRLIDCLHNGLPPDIDVYDTASWSAIGPLSEKSVSSRSNSVDIPDFTKGNWKTNEPLDVNLEKGGNTKVKI
jgi:predicted dehydrogenase